jgi:thiamine biosynthesis lipoprotein
MAAGTSLAARAFVIAALVAPAQAPPPSRFEYSEPHMGTLVRLVLYAGDAATADPAAKAAFARVGALDAALSDYRDSSELMQLSRRSGGPAIEVSDDLFRVLRAAQELAQASDGAFDPTSGPLSVLWREARRKGVLPGDERIATARALVGWDKVELDETRRTVRLRDRGMQLDLGGIAKGFAADEAAVTLRACGITTALIAAGGDIVAMAAPPGADGWRVAIAAIEGTDKPPAGYLSLRDAAVSTSGDAEQFLVVDGVRYSHIFDPRTGRALTGRSSVTVVAPNGTTTDGLATAVSVMGAVDGMRLVEATPGAAALIFEATADGQKTFQSRRWGAIAGNPRAPNVASVR